MPAWRLIDSELAPRVAAAGELDGRRVEQPLALKREPDLGWGRVAPPRCRSRPRSSHVFSARP